MFLRESILDYIVKCLHITILFGAIVNALGFHYNSLYNEFVRTTTMKTIMIVNISKVDNSLCRQINVILVWAEDVNTFSPYSWRVDCNKKKGG